MNDKIIKISALILLISGIFLIVIQPFQPITGAVIDLTTPLSRINFFLGFTLIIASIILFQINYFKNRNKLKKKK